MMNREDIGPFLLLAGIIAFPVIVAIVFLIMEVF